MSPINFASSKHLLLDIETSGLKRETDQVICIGVCYMQDNEVMTKQFLLNHAEAEKDFLLDFADFAKDFERVYTYNGKGFDWPFLLARYEAHGLTSPLKHLSLIDLKKPLGKLAGKRAELEALLGFQRQTQTEGKQLASLCKTYLTCQDEIYGKLIKAHNIDELNSLFTFYEIYQLLYHLRSLVPLSSCQQNSELVITFGLDHPLHYSAEFDLPHLKIKLLKDEAKLLLIVPIWHLTLIQPLEPLKDYRFVISQNTLMHKSLAQFLAKDDVRKPTKAECVLRQEGDYIKLYTTYRLDMPLWQDEAGNNYIPFEPSAPLPNAYYHNIFYYFFQENNG